MSKVEKYVQKLESESFCFDAKLKKALLKIFPKASELVSELGNIFDYYSQQHRFGKRSVGSAQMNRQHRDFIRAVQRLIKVFEKEDFETGTFRSLHLNEVFDEEPSLTLEELITELGLHSKASEIELTYRVLTTGRSVNHPNNSLVQLVADCFERNHIEILDSNKSRFHQVIEEMLKQAGYSVSNVRRLIRSVDQLKSLRTKRS